MPDVDLELVDRIKALDRSAMEELVAAYQDPVHGFICRYLGREEAEDITQDVFLRFFEKLRDFRGECSLRTWLYTLALNRCRDELRRGRYRREVSLDCDGEGGDSLPLRDRISDPRPGPEQELLRTEEHSRVERALSRLDDEARQIVLMRDMQELPYETIAKVVGIPEGTVKSRLHYARKRLGELMVKSRL